MKPSFHGSVPPSFHGTVSELSGALDRGVGKPGDNPGQDLHIGLLTDTDVERDAAVLNGVGIHSNAIVFQELQG